MDRLVHVKGLAELQKFLEQLPGKLQANVLRGALREGAKVVLADAKANVPIDTGTLKAGLRISTSSRRGVVTAKVKATGRHAYLAHWIEFGVRPHKIHPKTAKGLMMRPNARSSAGKAKRWVSHNFAEYVDHPGVRPRPFMRPALDSRAGEALVAVGRYMQRRLAAKHGFNTTDIEIELGDE